MNSCSLTGRLTKDPEAKSNTNGAYCFFCLAVDNGKDKEGKKLSEFIDCIAYGQPASFLGTYAHKGDLIELIGRVHTSLREDAEGRKEKRTTIIAFNVSILSHKEQAPEAKAEDKPKAKPEQISITDEADGLDLPFDI